jgi:hypothetical protein
MRVFVVNSEDAKAVGEYIGSHLSQIPAPFVVLARHLPMAVLYDPATLDLSDASVADRLRKQAKTRAVKVRICLCISLCVFVYTHLTCPMRALLTGLESRPRRGL